MWQTVEESVDLTEATILGVGAASAKMGGFLPCETHLLAGPAEEGEKKGQGDQLGTPTDPGQGEPPLGTPCPTPLAGTSPHRTAPFLLLFCMLIGSRLLSLIFMAYIFSLFLWQPDS